MLVHCRCQHLELVYFERMVNHAGNHDSSRRVEHDELLPRAHDQRLSLVRVQQEIIHNVPRRYNVSTGGDVLHTAWCTANRCVQLSVINILVVPDSEVRDECAYVCCEYGKK